MTRTCAALCALLLAAPALAGSPFYELTEAQKRKLVIPDIKALTGCLARYAAEDEAAAIEYRAGSFRDYIGRQLGRCPRELDALLEQYEATYGEGEAERFVKGPYLSDLPRAVLSLIRPQLDAKVEAAQASEQRTRDAQAATDAELRRKEEQNRIDTARLESERADVEAKARSDEQGRIATAASAMGLLRDRFYACVDQQLPGLVKSGESAEVIGTAAATICGKEMADVEDAAVEVARASEAPTDDDSLNAIRGQIRSLAKERVVADAVQAKAGVGVFAPK